jgi:hypothetical protein
LLAKAVTRFAYLAPPESFTAASSTVLESEIFFLLGMSMFQPDALFDEELTFPLLNIYHRSLQSSHPTHVKLAVQGLAPRSNIPRIISIYPF